MKTPCPNVSTTKITAMGYQQCLPLIVVQLKGKQVNIAETTIVDNYHHFSCEVIHHVYRGVTNPLPAHVTVLTFTGTCDGIGVWY